MIKNETIKQLIFDVVDEINAGLSEDQQLEKSITTVLYGENGKLDSIGLVNLIVAIEKKVEEELGAAITVANEKAISRVNSPFRTVGTMVDYVTLLLSKDT